MKIKFKKLRLDAKAPVRATDGSAGYDLFAAQVDELFTNMVRCCSGIAVEIPRGFVGLVFPRSSIVKTDQRLANAVGVIDSDYRGEITGVFDVSRETMFFHNFHTPKTYHPGERFAQLVIVPIPDVEYIAVEELSETARGTGGYGSTGK